jgi:hypothetical protein
MQAAFHCVAARLRWQHVLYTTVSYPDSSSCCAHSHTTVAQSTQSNCCELSKHLDPRAAFGLTYCSAELPCPSASLCSRADTSSSRLAGPAWGQEKNGKGGGFKGQSGLQQHVLS